MKRFETLLPVDSDGAEWFVEPECPVVSGLLVRSLSRISYAPIFLPISELAAAYVHFQVDAFDADAAWTPSILVGDGGSWHKGLILPEVKPAVQDKHKIRLPIEMFPPQSKWVCFSLYVSPNVEMKPSRERSALISRGIEKPKMPILVRGSWMEIVDDKYEATEHTVLPGSEEWD